VGLLIGFRVFSMIRLVMASLIAVGALGGGFIAGGAAACEPGHVGEPIPLEGPTGVSWSSDGVSVHESHIGNVWKHNYQAVPGGPCLAGVYLEPGDPDLACPNGPGAVGSPVTVSGPTAAYWGASGLEYAESPILSVQKRNEEPVQDGPCAPMASVTPGQPDFRCPGGSGPVGSSMPVMIPTGVYWRDPHAIFTPVGVTEAQAAAIQRQNNQIAGSGPCAPGMGVTPGGVSSPCPNRTTWSMGFVGGPTPDDGVYFGQDGDIYTGGNQRQVSLRAANDEVGGRCLPLVVVEPQSGAEWEQCVSCLP